MGIKIKLIKEISGFKELLARYVDEEAELNKPLSYLIFVSMIFLNPDNGIQPERAYALLDLIQQSDIEGVPLGELAKFLDSYVSRIMVVATATDDESENLKHLVKIYSKLTEIWSFKQIINNE